MTRGQLEDADDNGKREGSTAAVSDVVASEEDTLTAMKLSTHIKIFRRHARVSIIPSAFPFSRSARCVLYTKRETRESDA